MSSKFKPGDRVVVIKSDFGVPVGTELIVNRLEAGMVCTPTTFEGDPDDPRDDDPWFERELEHADVYNSKLYKLMQELEAPEENMEEK